MDLNKIHYFFKAVEKQNFTLAAKECHIAQTTMSKYISSLEHELQCPLFIRNHKNITLTKQGVIFYQGMKQIHTSYYNLCKQMNDEHQEINIGIKTIDFTHFKLLESFEKNHPDIKINYSYLNEQELIEGLQTHKFDALIAPALLSFYRINNQIQEITLSKEKVSLVCSKELLKQYQTIAQVIQHVPFISKSHEKKYHRLCKKELFSKYQTTFDDIIEVDEFAKQLLLLHLSRGFAILPTREIIYEDLYSEDITEELGEYEKTNLIYLNHYGHPSLDLLINHIMKESVHK